MSTGGSEAAAFASTTPPWVERLWEKVPTDKPGPFADEVDEVAERFEAIWDNSPLTADGPDRSDVVTDEAPKTTSQDLQSQRTEWRAIRASNSDKIEFNTLHTPTGYHCLADIEVELREQAETGSAFAETMRSEGMWPILQDIDKICHRFGAAMTGEAGPLCWNLFVMFTQIDDDKAFKLFATVIGTMSIAKSYLRAIVDRQDGLDVSEGMPSFLLDFVSDFDSFLTCGLQAHDLGGPRVEIFKFAESKLIKTLVEVKDMQRTRTGD
ncbi:MAG: hypothetical protein Q9218_002561 [Villophora microphyllina]